jgi:hypothetical protein
MTKKAPTEADAPEVRSTKVKEAGAEASVVAHASVIPVPPIGMYLLGTLDSASPSVALSFNARAGLEVTAGQRTWMRSGRLRD